MTLYSMPGFNLMLLGGSGTGKTYSIRTFVKTGVTPFIIFTEPGMRTISDVPCPDLHWHFISPAKPAFSSMMDSAKQVNNSFDFEALTKSKNWSKKEYTQFLEVYVTLQDFKCDRCGVSFGSVDSWQTDRCLVLDSLSGLSTMAMDLTVGSKPVKSPGDWGAAMDSVERVVMRLTGSLQCHFVLIGHLEREKDEISGGVKLMASTLGQKLSPKLPRNFDDVVMSKKAPPEIFTWSTIEINTDLKNRNLPNSGNLSPSYVQVLNSWKKAGGLIQPTDVPQPTGGTETEKSVLQTEATQP